MLNLEAEVVQLRDEGLLSAEAAGPLIAEERRDIVTVYTEVRALAWLGVMMIAGGAGVLVSKNLDRIGPLAVAAAIGLAAGGCYAYAGWRRASARRGVLDEFILILGSLLLSTDIGYIEHQFHLLGPAWPRHFLLLAVIHAIVAYVFESAAVLSLSIAALASWFGIERNVETFFTDSIRTATRAFACSGVVAVWRFLNRRTEFQRVFDHFILNLALWGGLILTFDDDTLYRGALAVIVLAVVTIVHGFRERHEPFVIYAFIYAVIAIDVVMMSGLAGQTAELSYLVVSTVAAIVGLFLLRVRFRRVAA